MSFRSLHKREFNFAVMFMDKEDKSNKAKGGEEVKKIKFI